MCSKIEFDKKHRGYRIAGLFVQNSHRCGYIEVPSNHPLYKKDYDECDIDVHGGLTYSRDWGKYPVKSKNDSWWIGFDCAHSGDATAYYSHNGDIFRTTEYVEKECKKVVDQLIGIIA